MNEYDLIVFMTVKNIGYFKSEDQNNVELFIKYLSYQR